MVKQIESEKSRNLTFKRRIRCIKKKTMELSTLCGIMACSVVLGPNGDIQTWPENPAAVRSVINFYDDQCVPYESQTEGRIEAGDESLRAAKMQEKIDEIEKEIDATKKENSRKLEALRMAVSRLNLLTKRVESAKAAANSVLERQSDDTMEKPDWNDKIFRVRKGKREMGVEILITGLQIRKVVIFSVRTCCRSVCDHLLLVDQVFFFVFLYRSFHFLFSLLVSASLFLLALMPLKFFA